MPKKQPGKTKWHIVVAADLDVAAIEKAESMGETLSQYVRRVVARDLRDRALGAVQPVGQPKKDEGQNG